jgi:hypothetical protein
MDANLRKFWICEQGERRWGMGIAERIYEVVRTMPEQQAAEILDFANYLQSRGAQVTPATRAIDLSVFRAHRGRYDGSKLSREELYDRAGLP